MSKKVLIALSGGVDSSVAAHLMLEQGYECIGATMQLLDNAENQIADAESVAKRLGIPFYTFDMRKEFREKIIDEFIKSYENCETPNPCVLCNREMKFGMLLDKAKVLGFYNALGVNELDITEFVNNKYEECKYVKGEMVYPDSFDEDRWHECSHGIHFFINKQDAINYDC